MLIVDSMLHLQSETPIQCRPPVAQSQLANRENTSSEPMMEIHTNNQQDMVMQDGIDITTALPPAPPSVVSPQFESNPQQQLLASPQFQTTLILPQIARSSFPSPSMPPPDTQYSQYSQAMAMTQETVPAHLRFTASFGYIPTSPENLIPLASLPSKTHGTTIGMSLFVFIVNLN
jgi:hypothetical protein